MWRSNPLNKITSRVVDGYRSIEASVADRSFGMLTADDTTGREILSEDLYDFAPDVSYPVYFCSPTLLRL